MGCAPSNLHLPPSPIPHSKAGPPPRPVLLARAGSFYDMPPPPPPPSSTKPFPASASRGAGPSPSPSISSSSTFSRSDTGFSSSTSIGSGEQDQDTESLLGGEPGLSAGKRKESMAKRFKIKPSPKKVQSWDIGPHSTTLSRERRAYTKPVEETEMSRVKGRWANRVKRGEDGEMWFY